MMNMARTVFLFLTWPLGLAASIWATHTLIEGGTAPIYAFLYVYLGLAVFIFWLERTFPYSEKWKKFDKQWVNDFAHTLISKTMTQVVIKSITLAIALYVYGKQQTTLPVLEGLPLWGQFALAFIIADIGHYSYHRLAHTRWGFWAFHALHHSAKRLWVGNTARGHFIDSTLFNVVGVTPLLLLQFSADIIFWVLIVNSFVGAYTHCNADIRLGWLNYVFNTPALHRWHHSKKRYEGNKNYGQLFAVWDLMFGTYHCPRDKRPPQNIGIIYEMPARIWAQLIWPFHALATWKKSFWTDIS